MSFSRILLYIFTIAILVFLPTLNFALAGDDWLALYRFVITFKSIPDFFVLSNYNSNYDIANIIMGIIYKTVGLNPINYYSLSLFFRILASISIYLILITLTRNKLASVFGSILSLVIFAGIETTDWVFNMNTYLSIIPLNIGMYLIIKFNITSWKINVLIVLSFILAFIIAPSRMHGLFFSIPTLILITSVNNNFLVLSKKILTLGIFLLPIFCYRLLTSNSDDNSAVIASLLQNITNFQNFFYLLANIGMIITPDHLLQKITPFYNQPNLIGHIGRLLITSIFILLPMIIISIKTVQNSLLFTTKLVVLYSVQIIIFWICLVTIGVNRFSNPILVVNALSASLFITLLFLYFIEHRQPKKNTYSESMYFLISIFSFLITPLLINPTSIHASYHRYLYVPATFFCICISLFVFTALQSKSKSTRTFIVIYMLGLLLLNTMTTQQYLNQLQIQGRSSYTVNYFFNTLNKLAPSDNTKPLVFLFETNNEEYLHNAIKFGFGYHMLITNPNLIQKTQLQPLPVDNFKSLIMILSDKNSPELYRYGYYPVEIPITNLYGYKVEKGQIIDQTIQLRNRVKAVLSSPFSN